MASGSLPFAQSPRPRKTRVLIASVLVGVAVVFAVVGFFVAHGLSSSSPASASAPASPRSRATAPGLGAGLVAAGTVNSLDRAARTFTLVSRSGATLTVDVTATTTFRNRSGSAASYAQLVVGDRVGVAGAETGTTVVATSVLVVGPGSGGGFRGGFGGGFGGAGAPSAFGTVKTLDRSARTFAVVGRGGSTITVAVSTTTTYADLSGSKAAFSTLAVGDRVAVAGTTTSAGELDAARITILPPPGSGGAVPGGGFGGPGSGGALPG